MKSLLLGLFFTLLATVFASAITAKVNLDSLIAREVDSSDINFGNGNPIDTHNDHAAFQLTGLTFGGAYGHKDWGNGAYYRWLDPCPNGNTQESGVKTANSPDFSKISVACLKLYKGMNTQPHPKGGVNKLVNLEYQCADGSVTDVPSSYWYPNQERNNVLTDIMQMSGPGNFPTYDNAFVGYGQAVSDPCLFASCITLTI
jgi:hypothetical protein